MRTKLYVLLFVFLLLLSACKKDESSSEIDNIQSETTSEEALNSGTQQAKEATGTQQVDNSKNRPALQQVDNKNIEHIFGMRYNRFQQKFTGINRTCFNTCNFAENIGAVSCAVVRGAACDKNYLFNT